jgi:signal transduction histidine kinase
LEDNFKIEIDRLRKQLNLIKETVTKETYNLGEKFFIEVVLKLNKALLADYTFIGKLNEKQDKIDTVALCTQDKILDNFSYALESTPCENVVGQNVCSYDKNVTKIFPKDQLLIDMGIEAYVGVPMFDSTKKPTGILVSLFKNPITDIETLESILLIFASRAGAELEHRKNQNELFKAKFKAEESNRLKTAFLANMSHEIRTPMNGILGFTDLLADNNLSHEKREYYANIVKSSSQQLLNIISDIIDISKIEAEEFTLSDTTFNVNEFLTEIIEQSRILLKQKNKSHIELTYNNADNIEILTVDKNRLAQVLLNLLSNAIKFTDSGSIQIIVESLNNDSINFSVIDTGIGIDKDNHKTIFERFRQVEDNSYEGGTGLGLSICKSLVEKMGGGIEIESEPGKGSKFNFTIKTNKNTVKEIVKENSLNQTLKNKKTKILIAEDEEINYLYLYEILNSDKYELVHALNGEIAVELFNQTCPDIVLMDIKMPIMNGYQALKEIKKLNGNIPVIAITAYAMSSDEKKAIDAGFSSYLPKPVPKEKLISVINKYVT